MAKWTIGLKVGVYQQRTEIQREVITIPAGQAGAGGDPAGGGGSNVTRNLLRLLTSTSGLPEVDQYNGRHNP